MMNHLLHYYCFHYCLHCYFHYYLSCCLTTMDSNFIVKKLRLQIAQLDHHHQNLQIQKENLQPSLRSCRMQNKLLLHEFLENLNSLNDLLLPFLEGTLRLNLVVVIKRLDLLPILKPLKDHGLIKGLTKAQDFKEMLLQFKVDFIEEFA